MDKYIEISVATTTVGSELVAYFLEEASPLGVCIFDANDVSEGATWDYAEESLLTKNEVVIVKGFCKKGDEKSVLSFLVEKFSQLNTAVFGSLETTTSEVEGDLWLQKWKETFVPLEIGSFVICPEWIPFEESDKKVLRIDSGVAFGTGQHETTRMCLELISELSLKEKSVVDIGCGSGILGLCALLGGAKSAVLIDNDKQATEATVYNAKLNGLLNRCEVTTKNLVDGTNKAFDIVLANLTAEILFVLSQDIESVVSSGSKVVLSGILADRVDRVKKCFTEKGFKLMKEKKDGEWCALQLER